MVPVTPDAAEAAAAYGDGYSGGSCEKDDDEVAAVVGRGEVAKLA